MPRQRIALFADADGMGRRLPDDIYDVKSDMGSSHLRVFDHRRRSREPFLGEQLLDLLPQFFLDFFE
jgi:hypothetical protein